MIIYDKILQWAGEQKLLIQQGEDDIVFQVNGQSGSWLSRVKALDEDGMIFVLCAYPFAVPEDYRADAALELDEISSNLKLGTFYLDENDGQINFRLAQFLWPDDEAETERRVRNIIMLAMNVTDTYYEQMMELAAEEEE